MNFTKMFAPTLREIPAEAEIVSHQLMLRAGLIRKLASGIYCFLPMGYRVIKKIEQIVREEMNNAGAEELLMPALLPSEAYQESGRWDVFGPEMFRLKDHGNRDFCLGPTHEEIFTNVVKHEINSYKSLPLTLYQIQTKYRDEIRPRFGVIRSREFIMKDAYSFDKDDTGLNISYTKMHDAYCKIFSRLNLDYIVVDADTGAMGGSGSQEFMVKSEVGEDSIATCNNCNFSANDEKAECIPNIPKFNINDKDELPLEEISTPNIGTISDLISFFDVPPTMFVKTLIYKADDEFVAALIRGDREINEIKLQNHLGCINLQLACEADVFKITNAKVGFAGPINLTDCKIVADLEVLKLKNFIVGANKTDYHIVNANLYRDFTPTEIIDIRRIQEGDICPKCGHTIKIFKGIEVGHIFKLGTKYTSALNCTFLDSSGKESPMVMGCYGIGINRTLAAIIEQNSDSNGIIWPLSIAPYHVIIIPINHEIQPKNLEIAEQIYKHLVKNGIEVILDDRNERPGVKFKDADLIGIPIRITVGKKATEGIVEFKLRKNPNCTELSIDNAISEASKVCNFV